MFPFLSLSLHDHSAETGPATRRERVKNPASGPYDNKNTPYVVPSEYAELPEDEGEANKIVEGEWKRESFLATMPLGLKVKLWHSIRGYGANALHKHFWTIAREDGLAALNRMFSPGAVTSVDSVTDLFRWESHVVLTMMLPNLLEVRDDMTAGRTPSTPGSQYFWTFSCHPEWNGGKIQVLCADAKDETLTKGIKDAYAFRESASLGPGRCGTYNCFFGNVSVPTTGDTSAVARAIKQFRSIESGAFPSSTAVRAPKYAHDTFYDQDKTFKEMFEQVSELFITLHMAQLGITPPVYAAVPVFKRGDDPAHEVGLKRTTHFGFAYMGEDGWSSLSSALKEFLSQGQTAALGTAIVECVRTTSDNFVLLLDVKAPNMIVKPKIDSTAYEVRMIDFGSAFSVNVNRFGKLSKVVPTTSSDCAFFVNGLLLLNYAYYYHRAKRQVFAELVLEVAATWYTMKELGRLGGFCAYLARDRVYAERLPRTPGEAVRFTGDDLSFVGEEKFFEMLSRVFYVVLEAYGARDGGANGVHVEETVPPVWLVTSYVERILNELKGATGWLESDADDARLRARIDAMKEERAPIMLE
jgi:hypothetical protein